MDPPVEVSATVEIDIPRAPEVVFDFVTHLETPARVFDGYKKIPKVVKTEVKGGGPLREGCVCLVHNSDGSIIERDITVVDRPRRHEYRLASGFKPPFSYLVTAGRGDWLFEPNAGGTRLKWVYTFTLTSPLAWPATRLIVSRMFKPAMVSCMQKTHDLLLQETV